LEPVAPGIITSEEDAGDWSEPESWVSAPQAARKRADRASEGSKVRFMVGKLVGKGHP
jgi:hypothetical protein